MQVLLKCSSGEPRYQADIYQPQKTLFWPLTVSLALVNLTVSRLTMLLRSSIRPQNDLRYYIGAKRMACVWSYCSKSRDAM